MLSYVHMLYCHLMLSVPPLLMQALCSVGGQSSPAVRRRHQRPTALHALEKADNEHSELAAGGTEAIVADSLDGEILRLLIPAILAVFLDPAMALIDTGQRLLSPSCNAIMRRQTS